MPSLDSSEDSDFLSTKVVFQSLFSSLLLDCRTQTDFVQSHIRGAISLTLPASSIMLRRLANGKVNVASLIKNPDSKEFFVKNCKDLTLILYDSDTELKGNSQILDTLLHRLKNDGCDVAILQGGFNTFQSLYPEWCESSDDPLLGLMALRISAVASDTVRQEPDSGLGDCCVGSPPFPVEILPNLYLGNASDSSDWEALERYGIHYVLNVTPNLPNTFEKTSMKYMQIPIRDHWSQNLSIFFPQAIDFIDEARKRKLGVLVHCLAGISRSVTITLAYLMHEMNIPLNEAYDFVQRRKANIAPNLNFLSQLKDYERQLNIATCHSPNFSYLCDNLNSPKGSTPDSAIHTDMWS